MGDDTTPLAPLDESVAALSRWLTRSAIPYAIVGGIATAVRARPRHTLDVDVLVWLDESRWADLVREAPGAGFTLRRTDALAFARDLRVLPMRHAATGVDIDVVFGGLPFERAAIDHATSLPFGGVETRVATPEDLAVMKAVALRPRDVADLESLLLANPGLDLAYVRDWVKQFADTLERPEIVEEFERVVARSSGER